MFESSDEKELFMLAKNALDLAPIMLSELSWWARFLLTLLKKPPKRLVLAVEV